MGVIRGIYIAADPGGPMVALNEVEAVAGAGLKGDRYFLEAGHQSADCQLTLIESESVEDFVREVGVPLAFHELRRNLVTTGIKLNPLVGKRVLIGTVEVEFLMLCEPCGYIGSRTHPKVVKNFVHRGGMRCKIVRGGVISIGDTLCLVA